MHPIPPRVLLSYLIIVVTHTITTAINPNKAYQRSQIQLKQVGPIQFFPLVNKSLHHSHEINPFCGVTKIHSYLLDGLVTGLKIRKVFGPQNGIHAYHYQRLNLLGDMRIQQRAYLIISCGAFRMLERILFFFFLLSLTFSMNTFKSIISWDSVQYMRGAVVSLNNLGNSNRDSNLYGSLGA